MNFMRLCELSAKFLSEVRDILGAKAFYCEYIETTCGGRRVRGRHLSFYAPKMCDLHGKPMGKPTTQSVERVAALVEQYYCSVKRVFKVVKSTNYNGTDCWYFTLLIEKEG